ncbi:zinc ABC transporter substrate-binding protein [Pseudooctadecabacter sp.]|uniref:zinc ABC transporter substrate-binding protein n=1 Tax=Pseudooctadecabacter sp. TaxID=1966338 RepID=UPI0035C842B6
MRLPLLTSLACLPLSATAEVPQVVTDIAPIHSLVSQVMEGLGKPDVLVSGGASPHDFQFSFDQADAVQSADLVIWVGPALTPWLDEALDTLGGDVDLLVLLEAEGWPALPLREDAAFEDHDDHGHAEHDEHDEDHKDEDHEGHDHDDHADHDEHSDARLDPHAWLDPQVAQAWVTLIATQLSDLDPDNAATYAANATAAVADLAALETEITARLAAAPAGDIIVPHDAYQYFGTRFDRLAVASITLDDAAAPAPDKIADLQARIAEDNIACVLTDPQARAEWSDLIREGSDARTALADPIGDTFDLGPQHYRHTL